LPQPGKSADGQHWVYRLDGHRKCWFQAAEETVAKKPVRHHAAKHVAAPKENEAVSRKRNAVVGARAELLNSALAETTQPAPPAPELKVVDAAPVAATGAAALVPPAPVVAKPATDRLTRDHPTPRQVDVETLLAAAPAASEAVAASVPPATPVAVSTAEVGDDGSGWTATWLGVLLMALGFVFLLSSSRTLRGRAGRIERIPTEGEKRLRNRPSSMAADGPEGNAAADRRQEAGQGSEREKTRQQLQRKSA
jgi:hypothetical protein